jgi:hypothetical protein
MGAVLVLLYLQDYVDRNRGVVVIDPLENVMKLFDRHQQYNLVKQCTAIDGTVISSTVCMLIFMISDFKCLCFYDTASMLVVSEC